MVLSSKSLVILKIRESFVVQHKIVKIRKDYFFLKFSIFIFFQSRILGDHEGVYCKLDIV